GAERQVLDAFGSGLDVPHRVFVESDRVPLRDFDDLVVDLDASRASYDDVDLFLRRVLVTERHPEVRCQLQQAQTERLAAERRTSEASVHLLRHAEVRRLILDVPEVRLRVSSHDTSLTRTETPGTAGGGGSPIAAPAELRMPSVTTSKRATRLFRPGGCSRRHPLCGPRRRARSRCRTARDSRPRAPDRGRTRARA